MPKTRTQFVCQQCGRVSAKDLGRCPQCDSWNSMVEEIVPSTATKPPASGIGLSLRSNPQRLSQITTDIDERWPLAMDEFARVLGGGIVPGSMILLGGDPGIGKSTLVLQLALELAGEHAVLYVSGEESERQIKMRAARLLRTFSQKEPLYPDKLFVVTETNLENITAHINAIKPRLLIVDSIQTTTNSELGSSAGSVSQVRECASNFREIAKTTHLAVILIGHVTKEGAIAGPKVLEHIVDTVLYLEGDRYQSYRLLRSVKNRFGATSEVGVFEMGDRGMVEVSNPSEAFLAERMVNAPGSAIAVTMEGTRPILVEIQGLTSHTPFGNPRRTPNGVDFNRLLLTVAVLTRRLGLKLNEQDVFVNVIGGLKVGEPAADLAVAAAIMSSIRNTPVRADTVLIGEIGLSGEIRMVNQMPARLREAARIGFTSAIVPCRLPRTDPWPEDIQILESRSLRQALDQAMTSNLKVA
ncbi:MAG: DNA repair protein RadA [Anaerolineales bacterium]|nr:DNA repair protein RadA [Anaerolineales bacterium]